MNHKEPYSEKYLQDILRSVKTIAMGEGGIITTDNRNLFKKLCHLRNHGMDRNSENFKAPEQAFAANGKPNPWYYEMDSLGFNYRASDIHCALGLSQLEKLDDFVQKQNRLVRTYAERLAPLSQVVKPVMQTSGGFPAWHVATVLIDFDAVKTDRATVMNKLRERGIGSQVLYMPLTRQPYYRNRYGELHLPNAEAYYARALCLPLFPGMTDDDVDRVVETLKSILGLRDA